MKINSLLLHVLALILIVTISSPIGYYIYRINSGKITYIAYLNSGKMVTYDYCINFSEIPNINILDSKNISKIEKKAGEDYLSQNPSYKGRVLVGYIKDKRIYQVNYGGKLDDIAVIKKSIETLKNDLMVAELSVYEQTYEKINLHCNGAVFKVYKYEPPNNQDPIFYINDSYKKLHVYLAAASPSLILSLIYILFIYWRVNRKSLMVINSDAA